MGYSFILYVYAAFFILYAAFLYYRSNDYFLKNIIIIIPKPGKQKQASD